VSFGRADAFGALLLVTAIFSAVVSVRSRPLAREPLERKGLAFTDDAASCDTCHPRQSAEWRRSAMAHAADSPLFLSLEMLIEEQIGRSNECPNGAGVLRAVGSEPACRDPDSGLALTGSGGEGWCVNCHAPGENLSGGRATWSRRASENLPLSSVLSRAGRDGVGCTTCHQATHPKRSSKAYRGNDVWRSAATGAAFRFRVSADDEKNRIANSGYALEPDVLLFSPGDGGPRVIGGAHRALDPDDRDYLASSAMCGTCHDVRLFGTDVLGKSRGEHFKRLRNGYTEWREFAARREARGEPVPSCQSCHMSTFPGVCVAGEAGSDDPPGCPPGTRFQARDPGSLAIGFSATISNEQKPIHPHYFTGVDVPLSGAFDVSLASERALDPAGIPLGLRARRDLLLARSVSLALGPVDRRRGVVEIPVTVENVGAGHRVPAGFSQERELWVHLTVTDARGRVLYEVGRVDRADRDLGDKVLVSVTTDDRRTDQKGRPLGLFGADVRDGPDVPRWDPPPERGGTRFVGRGLMSFQNGFLRCVRCRGAVDSNGRCQPLVSSSEMRADRYEDGEYDPDTGACVSNLSGTEALFETYFPVGSLDASRGIARAPDAIIDTRSLAPDEPVTYVYELSLPPGPLVVEARLLFRAFPPYLLRAFAEYEENQHERGRRPSGPLIDRSALERLDIVEIAREKREISS
jgi:hypothetical protein